MCGIAGILYRDSAKRGDPGLLQRMADAIAHRGPDGEGFWRGNGIGLAHRRLSIIDLETGTQPLSNEDGTIHITFSLRACANTSRLDAYKSLSPNCLP